MFPLTTWRAIKGDVAHPCGRGDAYDCNAVSGDAKVNHVPFNTSATIAGPNLVTRRPFEGCPAFALSGFSCAVRGN